MDPVVAPTDDFATDDLVVDLPYRDLVTALLGGLQPPVQVVGVRADETLGLALLSLSGVATYAAAQGDPASDDVGHLDVVLAELRAWFRVRCGGWVPDLGKNRFIGGVVGYPESKPLAGGGTPEPVTADRYQPSPDVNAGRGVRVGVLDTALYAHPALAGHYLTARSDLFKPEKGVPVAPWAGHATFVAGLVAAQAPGAGIVVRHLLANDTGRASAWETASAMVGFADSGVDVLNLSLGCRTKDGRPPLVMRRAVEVLGGRMVIVAAAGNHGATDHRTAPVWPAALPGVVAVGAVTEPALGPGGAPTLAEFSPALPWVDCVAPGFEVVSTYLDATVLVVNRDGQPSVLAFESYARWSGTSFAAAMVSGAIAKGTVPGQVTADRSLRHLLETPNPVVTRYMWRHDGRYA